MLERFQLLDKILSSHRRYWQLRPFSMLDLPWRHSNPELCHWLEDQPLQTLESNDQQLQELITCLSPFIEGIEQFHELCLLPQNTFQQQDLPAWLGNHIPGRKWQQIQAFEQITARPQLPVLEWCAGKGHLGRLISFQRQVAVQSLELNTQLCSHGQSLADKRHLPIKFVNQDALAAEAASYLGKNQHAVALHACGDLHLQLIKLASQKGTQNISVSPCCYHLIQEDRYAPLSAAAQLSNLRLDHHDLRLPLQETVTAPKRTEQMKQQEVSWRLGFDLLQRNLRNCNQYLNTPSLPKHLLKGCFRDYCHWIGEKKALEIPDNTDFSYYQQAGYDRYPLIRKIERVRHLYRRPLELWLVLDRALYLQQQGYQVSISEFCQRHLTPRNVLIEATARF
ncbi:hypothetical protein BGP75_08780 [Motiliproteus sp. MSK22-1]|nr:hypothetical protein BGP75_08780 [Motiliproteus sp. MSK22-1]